eukprot:8765867-Lingulodinium_polyedra.AAC.1
MRRVVAAPGGRVARQCSGLHVTGDGVGVFVQGEVSTTSARVPVDVGGLPAQLAAQRGNWAA